MNFILIFIFTTSSILISKYFFNRWINHLSIYAFTWGVMIFLYELKLLAYYDISGTTWFIIIGSYLSFFFGVVTIYVARGAFSKKKRLKQIQNEDLLPLLLQDDGRVLKYSIFIFSLLGFLGAVQNWVVLFNKFGNILNIFLYANSIYRLRVEGNIPGVIPYLTAFCYVGLFLSGIYTAYKNKFTIVSLLPIIAILLKSIAQFSRILLLMGIVEYLITLILFRYFILRSDNNNDRPNSGRKTIAIIISVIVLMIAGATIVKTFRGTYESFKGTNSQLSKLKNSMIITPSIYLYLSSDIGVLNKYLSMGKEQARFGENTLAPFYNLLAKFDLTEKVPYDTQGYLIPMWTNSGTYLREIHADYGIIGVFLIPYLLGLFTTFFWFRFYSTGGIIYFILMVYSYTIITISFFSSVTRGADWFVSLFILLVFLSSVEKYFSKETYRIAAS